MITCKYCGSTLKFIGEYAEETFFHCEFCDLTFEKKNTCLNRSRKESVPEFYNQGAYYRTTKELLNANTVVLFHYLKDCRKDWYNMFSLLKKIMNIKEDELPNQKDIDSAFLPLYSEYVKLTKQKFVIENILLEKAGFLPSKITEQFLSDLIEQGKKASKKPMYIYINKD